MKKRAAKTAVLSYLKSKSKNKEEVDESKVKTEVEKLLKSESAMGHTWIKLREQEGKTIKKELWLLA